MKIKKISKPSFEDYYAHLFGPRWPQLSQALRTSSSYVACLNPFVAIEEKKAWLSQYDLTEEFCDEPPVSYAVLKSTLDVIKTQNDLLLFYPMDWASVWAACLLPIEPTKTGAETPFRMLDLCAAPGGKSLILAARVSHFAAATLVCNELSAARRHRLQNTLKDYLPPFLGTRVSVKGHDASRWGLHEPNYYDAILLDAPCSSERHVLNDEQALKIWTPSRVLNLAMRQYALLCSALMALKSGGYCLYSTCSINPAENENVITKLIKKKGTQFEVVKIGPEKIAGAENAEHGYYQMPDKNGMGWGPIYVCLLKKT